MYLTHFKGSNNFTCQPSNVIQAPAQAYPCTSESSTKKNLPSWLPQAQLEEKGKAHGQNNAGLILYNIELPHFLEPGRIRKAIEEVEG